jgi:hypothetical protein
VDASIACMAPTRASCIMHSVITATTSPQHTLECSRNIALVGDAGHSVWPSLGQGANSALQGAATFAKTLQGTQLILGWLGAGSCAVTIRLLSL